MYDCRHSIDKHKPVILHRKKTYVYHYFELILKGISAYDY